MSVFCAGNISHFHLIYLCKKIKIEINFLKNKNDKTQITDITLILSYTTRQKAYFPSIWEVLALRA